MERKTAFTAEPVPAAATITLKKDVSALEIVRRENAKGHFGGLALISKGSRLEICGSGFNERTYKVRCQNRLFFVFQQDLGAAEPSFSL
jgi:hypothetical protein